MSAVHLETNAKTSIDTTIHRPEANMTTTILYGVGGFGNNILFMFIATYLMFFYTDVMKISAVTAGSIFMIARLVDAFTDPVMGMIIDKTNSKRWGKYRPYLLLATPMMAILFVVMFTVPNLSMSGTVIYAGITYILYSLAWTAVQTPYLALPILMSHDINKRTKIIAIVQGLSSLSAIMVTTVGLPLFNLFGGQLENSAWTILTILFAIIFVVTTYLATHAVSKIDVYIPVSEPKTQEKKKEAPFKKAIFYNVALLVLLIGFGTDSFANAISGSLNMYFYRYNMGNKVALMGMAGFAQIIGLVIFLPITALLTRKYGKKICIMVAETVALLMTALLLLFPASNTVMMMVSMIGTSIVFVFVNIVIRAAVLDSANYCQWKFHQTSNALIASTFTFVNKCAQALGIFLMGFILSLIQYVPQAETQADNVLRSILLMRAVIPMVAFGITVVAMIFYPLSKKKEMEMQSALSA